MCAGRRHAVPRRITSQGIEGTGRVGHHKYIKARLDCRQRRERHADFGHHPGDDQLFLASRLDGFDKVLVVPGVDLPWARNVRSIREQSLQLRHQWAVRARFKAGRENRRQFEVLGQIGQRQHVVLELVRIDVAYQRQQTGLMVDQQYGRLIFIETFVGSGHFHSPGEQRKP
ncbi:hypothetical protein D3C73_280860 [compost metagenome]